MHLGLNQDYLRGQVPYSITDSGLGSLNEAFSFAAAMMDDRNSSGSEDEDEVDLLEDFEQSLIPCLAIEEEEVSMNQTALSTLIDNHMKLFDCFLLAVLLAVCQRF